ncbi:MAG TPA: hypothetical protein VGG82_13015 [Casimicrobiaceae bacterium]|jgi:hypothetical protein
MQSKWRYSAAIAAFVGAMSAMAVAGAAQAHWPTERVSVDIIDRTDGRVLPIYTHEGRRYVVGKPGNEYAIRVHNGGGGRALAVMSVDGVNVITGDTASPSQSGYVLDAHGSFEIAGWRTSQSRTAAFFFTTLANSYATRTGRPDNVGVIGVAVFRERPRVVQQFGGKLERQEAARDEADRPASPAASGSSRESADSGAVVEKRSQIGTGYGRSETSYAQYTDFQRASDTPTETIAIYYDSYENLLAQGVPVGRTPIARARPEPFPDWGHFAPPPR